MRLTALAGMDNSAHARLKPSERFVFAFYAAVFGWWVFDLNEADTALITPADERLVGGLTLLGALLGIVLGSFIVRYSARTWVKASSRRTVGAAMIALPTFGAWYALILNHAAWRTADMLAFSNVSAPINPAEFPIISYRVIKSRPAAFIGTKGEERPIPILPADYRLLKAAHYPSDYCLVLNRQQAGSAVRVFRLPMLLSGGGRRLSAIKRCERI